MKTLDELLQDVVKLEGDKNKLTTGASLPASLVEGANRIHDLTAQLGAANTKLTEANSTVTAITKERDDAKVKVTALESEKVSLDAAVAKELAKLGIQQSAKAGEKAPEGCKKPTITEKILAKKGCQTLAELEQKGNDSR